MKKRLSAFLLAALLLVTGSALAIEPEKLAASIGDFSAYGTGNLEKYDPPIKATIGISISLSKYFPEGDSYEDNVWSRAYRDELGIELELAFTTADLNDKVNTMIAAGDLPDILQVNKAQLALLVDSGLIYDDLTEAYEANAGAGARTLVEGVGDVAALAQSRYDGELKALPMMSTSAGAHVPVLWLRTDWMEKLGLSDPQNYAQLRAVMEAFVSQDPDGNGVDDTYGIVFTKSPWSTNFHMDGFFNIFGAHPKSEFWVQDPENPDQVVYGAFQPEVKAALAELRGLYAEGLLHPEFAIFDEAAAREVYASGKCGVLLGAVYAPNSVLYASHDLDANADWHALAVPGLEGPTTRVTASIPVNSYLVFSKDFEHPEAVLKMINLQFDKCFGENATTEVYSKYIEDNSGLSSYTPFTIYPWGAMMPAIKNELSALYIANGYKSTDPAMPTYARAFATWCEGYEASGDPTLWRWYRFFGPDGGHLITSKYLDEDLYYLNGYFGPNTETMNDNLSLVTTLVDEMIVKIVMGEAALDDFDAYKAQAEGLGLGDMTREANEWLAQLP